MIPVQYFFYVLLVNGIGIGVQQTHGHRVHLLFSDLADDLLEPFRIEFSLHFTGVEDSLRHLEAQVPGHQGLGAPGEEVVQAGPILPHDVKDIPEPLGDDEGALHPFPFEQGIGGHGGPVDEEADVFQADPNVPNYLLDGVDDAPGLVLGRGGHLGQGDTLVPFIEKQKVRKGSPHINAQSVTHIMPRSGSPRCSPS